MKLPILFENDNVVVVNKPYGMVVHPGAGVEMEETVVGELLGMYPGLPVSNGEERPGVVHRLDKDTSGVLLVAKTDDALKFYIDQWKGHKVEKIYIALVAGILEPRSGTIEAPVSRSSKDRQKMTAMVNTGKMAVTHYEVVQYFRGGEVPSTLVRVRIETGRTHQIRVHFGAIGFPVVGDTVYGNRRANLIFKEKFGLQRQFLQATSLTFPLMMTGAAAGDVRKKPVLLKQTVDTKIPPELQEVLDQLE